MTRKKTYEAIVGLFIVIIAVVFASVWKRGSNPAPTVQPGVGVTESPTPIPANLAPIAEYLAQYADANPVYRETMTPSGATIRSLHIGGVSTGEQRTVTEGKYTVDVLDVYFRSRAGSVFAAPVAVGVETDGRYFSLALDLLGQSQVQREKSQEYIAKSFPGGQGMAVIYSGEMTDPVFGMIWDRCSPVTIYGRLPNDYCNLGQQIEGKFRLDNMNFVQGVMEAAPDGWFLYGFFPLAWEDRVEKAEAMP